MVNCSSAPQNSLTEWWLGGALGSGYHLMRVLSVSGCLTPADLANCVADLVRRGVPDDGTDNPGTARSFCDAPYRLQPTTLDETIVLKLGALPGAADAGCP